MPIIFDNLPSALPFIRSGQLVASVVAAPRRVSQLPQVPTFDEGGLGAVNRMAYYGIYRPKGLPQNVVEAVNSAVQKTLDDAVVRQRIDECGAIIVANTPEQFAAQIVAEFAVYEKVVREQRLELE